MNMSTLLVHILQIAIIIVVFVLIITFLLKQYVKSCKHNYRVYLMNRLGYERTMICTNPEWNNFVKEIDEIVEAEFKGQKYFTDYIKIRKY